MDQCMPQAMGIKRPRAEVREEPARPTQKDEVVDQLLKALSRLSLKVALGMRETQACVYRAALLPAEHRATCQERFDRIVKAHGKLRQLAKLRRGLVRRESNAS